MTWSTDAAPKFEPTKPDNGGRAFPSLGGPDYVKEPGMSLRDWFAGQAMAAMMTSGGPDPDPEMAHLTARDAYCFADAMIAARGR